MSTLDRFLPAWSLRQVDRIAVVAEPDEAWRAVRALDFYASPFVRGLFALRGLPDRLLRGAPAPPPRMTLDDIDRAPAPGFHILDERDGEIVFGAIGKVWKPHIPFLSIAPADYGAFAEPGWIKVAWSITVQARSRGGSSIRIDVRVAATDEPSLRRFRRYWRLIGPFSHLIRRLFLARMRRVLGGIDEHAEDEALRLAGDELLPGARRQLTMSRTIETPPSRLWPWLAQLGCRRGGWYSWDRLDNGGIPSATRVDPALQRIAVGDLLPATPEDPGGFAVLRVEPPRLLVLGSPELLPAAKTSFGLPYRMTWQFALDPLGDDATRLRVRVRGDYLPTLRTRAFLAAWLQLHRFMQSAQLRHLAARCEATA